MISKDTYRFIMNRIATAKQAELLMIRDELQELLRNPLCHADKELWRDTKKTIRKINEEIDARYDLYLIEKARLTSKKTPKTPASASVVHLRQNRSGV